MTTKNPIHQLFLSSHILALLMVHCFHGSIFASERNSTMKNAPPLYEKELVNANPFYYAHWVITKKRSIPHIPLPTGNADYASVEGEYAFYIGTRDNKHRLTSYEKWVRERYDVPFAINNLNLDANMIRYFIVLEDNNIQEVAYDKTNGENIYVMARRRQISPPGQKQQFSESIEIIHQYMMSKIVYTYKGNTTIVLNEEKINYQSPFLEK